MISYKTYKLLNESFGPMSLGLKSQSAFSVGSKLAEMGLTPDEEKQLGGTFDDEMGPEEEEEGNVLGDIEMGDDAPVGDDADVDPDLDQLGGASLEDEMGDDEEMGDDLGGDEFGAEDDMDFGGEESEEDEMASLAGIPKDKPKFPPVKMESKKNEFSSVKEDSEDEAEAKKAEAKYMKKKEKKRCDETWFAKFCQNARGDVHKGKKVMGVVAEDAVIPPANPNAGIVGSAPSAPVGQAQMQSEKPKDFFGYGEIPSFSDYLEWRKHQ